MSNDTEYQQFLDNKRIEDQEKAKALIFSEGSKAIYTAVLQLLTKEPQPFSELKSKVNKATGLDDAWHILSGLVQAGLAKTTEISFEISGQIKKNVKFSYSLV